MKGRCGLLLETESWTLSSLRSDRASVRNRAWQALYEQHVDGVYRLVSCLGVAEADVDDVIQRVFVVAHRRIKEIETIYNVRAWLRGIAVRVVADHRAWHRVRRLKQGLLRALTRAETPPAPTPERCADAAEVRRLVHDVLGRMSPKLRDVLVLVDLEECKPGEAAALLRVPVNTVRSRRRLAREEFLRIWPQVCGSGAP